MAVYNTSSRRASPDTGAAAPSPDVSARLEAAYRQLDGFLDARVTQLSDRAFRVFEALDGLAGSDAFCLASNELIGRKTYKKPSTLGEIFRELEDSGWIWRVYSDSTMRKRIGVLLFRRVDPESPSTRDIPEAIDLAIQAMRKAVSEGGRP